MSVSYNEIILSNMVGFQVKCACQIYLLFDFLFWLCNSWNSVLCCPFLSLPTGGGHTAGLCLWVRRGPHSETGCFSSGSDITAATKIPCVSHSVRMDLRCFLHPHLDMPITRVIPFSSCSILLNAVSFVLFDKASAFSFQTDVRKYSFTVTVTATKKCVQFSYLVAALESKWINPLFSCVLWISNYIHPGCSGVYASLGYTTISDLYWS